MNTLIREVKEWNTPVVSGYLLWKFTQGYYENHQDGEGPIAINHFLALPILMSNLLLEKISNRRKSLQSYVRSFEEEKRIDLLAGIHDGVRQYKILTLKSIDIAVTHGLLAWDYKTGRLYPSKISTKIQRDHSIRQNMVKMGSKAEILGKWFSQHDVLTVAAYLKVVL